ncbi:hypothetical protein A2Z33_00010 [Candidatus Gottesmanbacteria bacterium RBG_16_52_11]|uniref:Uncharacterized protein n=1 Tax=Candidatus Gottesmanbacteria bacterium RBG_16_52_11 TaxID=1798374 RepID=A0A1F5YN31_9BACT|nr:MAG: hypothetical protein A2Z33_00010 [Candidatus Gottesmanbacteria bacterium RBG_16_52_11]
MAAVLIILLALLWFFGYIRIPGLGLPDIPLFRFGSETVTLLDLVIFLVIIWAVGVLPSPLREIGYAGIVIWILAELGIIAIAGLSSIVIWAIIIGLVLSLLHKY